MAGRVAKYQFESRSNCILFMTGSIPQHATAHKLLLYVGIQVSRAITDATLNLGRKFFEPTRLFLKRLVISFVCSVCGTFFYKGLPLQCQNVLTFHLGGIVLR